MGRRMRGIRAIVTSRRAVLLAATLLTAMAPQIAAALPPVRHALPPTLWGRVEIADRWAKTDVKWRAMAERHAAQRAALDAGRLPAGVSVAAVERWQRLLETHAAGDPAAKLAGVDAALDRQPYRSDREAFGEGDRWLTPLEFLENGGDCEDYAIAKYFLLRELGMPAEALRLLVVRDRVRALEHAVLLARDGRDWMVLDNLRRRPVPLTEAAAWEPLYAIGEAGGFFYLPAAAGRGENGS